MEHLYTVADGNSIDTLNLIPNQDCKSAFQTNILWTSRALKDWANDWFIQGNPYSTTPLHPFDHWLPGLTGQMVNWMSLGTYCEAVQVNQVSNETMIERIDKLEGLIDRLMNSSAVDQTISKFLNLKENLDKNTNQKNDSVFTSKTISQMGDKLGNVGTTSSSKSEDISLLPRLSNVKLLFKTLRDQSLIAMSTPRPIKVDDDYKPFPMIWQTIDTLAEPLYADLQHLNELIEDRKGDFENPGKHCSVTHTLLCPSQLRMRITSFKLIIQQGVIDIMTNQALLPQIGLNTLDSMFNQLWELGERGPNISIPGWCQQAIDCINGFEDAMTDAWDEVYDCWEREFITRLWRIEVEHHGGGNGCPKNYVQIHENTVETSHDHTHTVIGDTLVSGGNAHSHPVNIESQPSSGCDSAFQMTSPLEGYLSCPGHLVDLLKPVCVGYREQDIEPLAQHYRSNLKNLCRWMVSAIEAIGLKFSAISVVMSDPSLNGSTINGAFLSQINLLREHNSLLLEQVEHAYGLYSDVNNMKSKREYD